MPRPKFYALTAIGSTIWNVLLIGAGWVLGRSWKDVESYSTWINLAVLVAIALAIGKFVWDRRNRIGHTAGSRN